MLEFDNKRPIYIQIMDNIIDNIIRKKYVPGERIPSIRDYAKECTVNQNTIMKCYQELERQGIIETKRGVGYSIVENEKIIEKLKKDKIRDALKNFLKDMYLSGFTKEEILDLIEREG